MNKSYEEFFKFFNKTYKKTIKDCLGLGNEEYTIHYYPNSEEYADTVTPVKLLHDENISFMNIFGGSEGGISEVNCCTIDKLKFVKIITPFVLPSAHDIIVVRSKDFENVKKALDTKSRKRNFRFNTHIIGDKQEEIVNELIDFLTNEELKNFCTEKMIPFKRSYVFEGQPGTGKTLSLKLLKEKCLESNINFQSVPIESYADFQIDQYIDDEQYTVLVFEDFDACVEDRRFDKEDKSNKAVEGASAILSKTLNILDGVNELHGIVSIFTTNQIKFFDNAFLRSGRIDKVITFELPTIDDASNLIKYYLNDQPPNIIDTITNQLENLIKKNGCSFSFLKGICDRINMMVFRKELIDESIVKQIVKDIFSQNSKSFDRVENKENHVL